MCGIVGTAGLSNMDNPMSGALAALHHRGPDRADHITDGPVMLGQTRLSIIDLSSAADQPMLSADGRYVLVFNGEIYNYIELRDWLRGQGRAFRTQSDTEVLLQLLISQGVSGLSRVRGVFACAFWDRDTQHLLLARDRFGEKPLIYAAQDGALVFASEIAPLLALMPQNPPLSAQAFFDYLHLQYVPEPETPFEGVRKLLPGHVLEWTAQRGAQITRWAPLIGQAAPTTPINPAEAPSAVREALFSATRLMLRSDVKVGIALSGGVDSTAVAATAAALGADNLAAYCVGYPGEPAFDERPIARASAKRLGLALVETEIETGAFVDAFADMVRDCAEPIGDIAAFGHRAVARLLSANGCRVMLSGTGGDEVFIGYNWLQSAIDATHARALNPPTHAAHSPAAAANIVRALFGQRPKFRPGDLSGGPGSLVLMDAVKDFGIAHWYAPRLLNKDLAATLDASGPFYRAQRAIEPEQVPLQITRGVFETWLTGNCLALADRLSMSASLEARLPLLDPELVETVMAVRKTERDWEPGGKALIKAAVRGLVPDDVLDAPKKGFQPPVQAWIMGALARHGEEIAASPLADWIDRKALTRGLSRSRSLPLVELRLYYKLLTYAVWLNRIRTPAGTSVMSRA